MRYAPVISSGVEKSQKLIKVNRTIKEPVWGYSYAGIMIIE